jgi:hypothetical protein
VLLLASILEVNLVYEMAKRMRMLTNEEYEKLHQKSGVVSEVNEKFFHKTNQKASDILDAKDIPDDIKLQLYGSVMTAVKQQLNEILNKPVNVNFSVTKDHSVLADALNEFTPTATPFDSPFKSAQSSPLKSTQSSPSKSRNEPLVELSESDLRLLKLIPENFRERSRDLLHMLKQVNDIITWDTTGRVTFFKDELVPDSNLVDLLNYSLRDIKFHDIPAGTNRFLRILKIVNVPSQILSREAKKGYLRSLDQMPIREQVGNSRASDFYNWMPVRTADQYSPTKTPAASKTPRSSNITQRKRHRPKNN